MSDTVYLDQIRQGARRAAIEHLRRTPSSPTQAYLVMVGATETEARLAGIEPLAIPHASGLQRLIRGRRLRAAARAALTGGAA